MKKHIGCGCGNKGCLEAYASGPAIAAMGMKAVTQGLTTCVGEMCEYDLNRITPELIARAARAGDGIAGISRSEQDFILALRQPMFVWQLVRAPPDTRLVVEILDPLRRVNTKFKERNSVHGSASTSDSMFKAAATASSNDNAAPSAWSLA